ncbi:MAG TPA: XRE family transcriptional regulator [Nitrospirae bacterium]|nr:XRE family transcriptional regulator [Nitrospirota bacterium]
MRDRRIREAIEKHGYSRKEIADHLNLRYSTISRLVRDETSKSNRMLKNSLIVTLNLFQGLVPHYFY